MSTSTCNCTSTINISSNSNKVYLIKIFNFGLFYGFMRFFFICLFFMTCKLRIRNFKEAMKMG
jgi:hypothetical protein